MRDLRYAVHDYFVQRKDYCHLLELTAQANKTGLRHLAAHVCDPSMWDVFSFTFYPRLLRSSKLKMELDRGGGTSEIFEKFFNVMIKNLN